MGGGGMFSIQPVSLESASHRWSVSKGSGGAVSPEPVEAVDAPVSAVVPTIDGPVSVVPAVSSVGVAVEGGAGEGLRHAAKVQSIMALGS
jgi:hypothetical protein